MPWWVRRFRFLFHRRESNDFTPERKKERLARISTVQESVSCFGIQRGKEVLPSFSRNTSHEMSFVRILLETLEEL